MVAKRCVAQQALLQEGIHDDHGTIFGSSKGFGFYGQPPWPGALSNKHVGKEYWRKVNIWENVNEVDFLSYRWQVCTPVKRPSRITTLPADLKPDCKHDR